MTARLALVLAVLAGCTITPADAAPTQTAPVSGLIEAAEALEKINAHHGVKLRHAEIDEVAGRIANGAAICCATWRDTEARGWLWYCSLPLGHDGHHRCIGATW